MKSVVRVSVAVILLCWSFVGTAEKWVPVEMGVEKPTASEVKLVKSDEKGLTIEMSLPGFQSRDTVVGEETYQQLEIPGGGFTADIGSPELPVVSTHLEVPFGAQAEVEVTDSKFKVLPGYNIYPAQEPWLNLEEAKKPPFTKNDEVYSTNVFFPEKIVQVSRAGELRGYRIVFFAVFPVQYNPVTKELKVYSKLTLRLNYTELPEMTDALEIKAMKRKAKFSKDFEPLYRAAILNYAPPSEEVMMMVDTLKKKKVIDTLRVVDTLPIKWIGPDYLIITHDHFYNAVLPLKQHRETQDGFSVQIVKLSQIPPGDANAIKNYIKYTWLIPPTYVLLVGDADYLPTNYVTDHPSYTYEENEKIGTDLYYSTLTAGDYYPDLFLGRLPADTIGEIRLMVDRIIDYEKNPPKCTGMFKRVLLAALDEFGRPWIATCDDIAAYLTTLSYTCIKVYTGGTYTGTTTDVINAINQGVFLAIHRDHGNSCNAPVLPCPDGWDHPPFNTTHIPSLSNGEKVPVMFSMNCRTGWFDGETDKDTKPTITDCLGEELLSHTNGGVVGFIGSTRASYSGYNDEMTFGFVDAIFPNFNPTEGSSTSLRRLGQILNQGKQYMYNKYVTPGGVPSEPIKIEYEMFHLLGDPAMKIRTEEPRCKCGCGAGVSFIGIVGFILLNSFRRKKRSKRSKGE
jgi:hypothetical protein